MKDRRSMFNMLYINKIDHCATFYGSAAQNEAANLKPSISYVG